MVMGIWIKVLYLGMENVFTPLQITLDMLSFASQFGEVPLTPSPGKGFCWVIISINGVLNTTRIGLN